MISLINYNNLGEKKLKNTINIYYNENIPEPDETDITNANTNTMMIDTYNGVCQIMKLIYYIKNNVDDKVSKNIILKTTDTRKSPDLYALSNNIIYKYNDIITLIKYNYL